MMNPLYQNICSYMDDDLREAVHSDLAPCSGQAFIDEYIKRDPDFIEVICDIFGVDLRVYRVFEEV